MSTSEEEDSENQESSASSQWSESSEWASSPWDPMDAETYRLILLWLDPKASDLLSPGGAKDHQEELQREDRACSAECQRWRNWAHDPELSTLRRSQRRLQASVVRASSKLIRKGTRNLEEVKSTYDMIVRDEELQYTPAELKLRKDLAANKACWYGDWSKDLLYFLGNNNPVLSICFSHPLHPVSRNQRWVAYLLQMLFVFYTATFLTEAQNCLRCGIRGCQDAAYRSCFLEAQSFIDKSAIDFFEKHYPGISADFCCVAERGLVLFFLGTFGKWGGPLYAILSNCVFTVLVFQMMMCLCMQKLTPRKRELGSLVGYVIVSLIGGVLLFFAPMAGYYIYLRRMFGSLFLNFVLGKLGSWAFVTCINVIGFSFMWKAQRRTPLGDSPTARKFWVTADDFHAFSVLHPEGPDRRLSPARLSGCCGCFGARPLPVICDEFCCGGQQQLLPTISENPEDLGEA